MSLEVSLVVLLVLLENYIVVEVFFFDVCWLLKHCHRTFALLRNRGS